MSYFLNKKTSKLHIQGFCKQSKSLPYDIEYFENEEDIAPKTHKQYIWCLDCQRERDNRLSQMK